MIRRVRLGSFKRFGDQTFELDEATVLVGPNNSGKSHAAPGHRDLEVRSRLLGLAARARPKVREAHGRGDRSRGIHRCADSRHEPAVDGPGGLGRQRARSFAPARNRCGGEVQRRRLGVRTRVSVRQSRADLRAPVRGQAHGGGRARCVSAPASQGSIIQIVRVPALSGIQRDEPRHQRGMQDLLIGQGRSGDILRNLLLEIGGRDGRTDRGHSRERRLDSADQSRPRSLRDRPYAPRSMGLDSPTSPANTESGRTPRPRPASGPALAPWTLPARGAEPCR